MSDKTPLLMQIIIRPERGTAQGMRVYENGRYEILSDRKMVLSPAGRVTPVIGQHRWRLVWQFSDSEMTALRELLRETDFYRQPPPAEEVDDGHRYAWEVHLDGQVYKNEIGPVPMNAAIERFFQQFAGVRQLPAQSSVWRIWVQDHYEERLVKGQVNGVVALRPLVQALLVPPSAPESDPPAAQASELDDDHLVAYVSWQQDEQLLEESQLWANGRYTVTKEGQIKTERSLTAEQVNHILAIAEAIDWDTLPNPIDVT